MKNYNMGIPANELETQDAAGVVGLIAKNPDAYADGTVIKIITGTDVPATPAIDTAIFIVLSDKTVLELTAAAPAP